MKRKLLCLLLSVTILFSLCKKDDDYLYNNKSLILVCGDTKVLLIENTEYSEVTPEIIWSWEPKFSEELPYDFRVKKFNTLDDCKSVNSGKQILVSSSSGAIALVNRDDKKVVFYAAVPNAHSIEMLPNNKIVAAASTHNDGNKLMVFDKNLSDNVLFTDDLYSAHGVVWDSKRNSLFALGYDVLREYKIENEIKLELVEEWIIPGKSGHDLQMSPNGNQLFLTESTGAWLFDIPKKEFEKIKNFPDAKNIKSIGQNEAGQFVFTVPEENWWTFHVSLYNPSGKIPFPDLRVYKARWF